MQIKIPISDEDAIDTVKWYKRDINGKPIGISNDNPLLGTRLYTDKLPNGAVEELAADYIA